MNPALRLWFSALAGCVLGVEGTFGQTIPVSRTLWRLEAQEDTDRDQKITIHDRITPFEIRDASGTEVRTLTNVYRLSVLVQELKRAENGQHDVIPLDQLQLDESPVNRTHRLIKTYYWNALTRRIDAAHIDQVVHDSKVATKVDFLYVPGSDGAARRYFESVAQAAAKDHRWPELRVVAVPLPDKTSGAFVRHLDGSHGLLSLALETSADGRIAGVPYVVPGGRFNELYGWDSYFIVLGLLQDGRTDLARGTADNLLYEVRHYGKILNANRSYYLTRSQPPFLTSIVREVYQAGAANKDWLAAALQTAMGEYQNVWLGRDRLVKAGQYELSRYYDSGSGPCPEVEPGHYDEPIQPWLAQVKPAHGQLPLTPFQFLNEYLYCGKYARLKADGMMLDAYFKNDRAVRESGHDTTHRFDDRTTEFVTVDLNSLLYKYEMDFAELIQSECGGRLAGADPEKGDAGYWRERAAARKQAMLALMWDESPGYLFDYDCVHRKRFTYISATGLWPLWAKLFDATNPAEMNCVRRAVAYGCEKREQPAGLAATARESVESARRHDARQWDYPYGWAPHQMLAWQGLRNYGLDADAARLAYRWLYNIARNARDYNGTIPEKYNVVTGSHEVFVEYGNVGTKFSYITPEGFGWMNASFEVGKRFLPAAQLEDLRQLKAPATLESRPQ